ncbi:MAG TPA: 4,5-DOPA dioxygenase extradiol [Candidatus Deferrimicrobiaceae bacterium]
MPALFVGHGSPMNAIEENAFSRAWAEAAAPLSRPEAILCISAHWETAGTQVTAMERPRTIHDFHGFPRPLFEVRYPAPGSPGLARLVRETVRATPVEDDFRWGLDHGAWSVLRRMFPPAEVPVVQLSLDRTKDPAFHYALGRELLPLRKKGILIVGSGNIVHNLGRMVWKDTAYDWAVEFDERVKGLILSGDHEAIVGYPELGEAASLSVPSNEHYLPLLYVLALQEEGDRIGFFAERVTLGSISMRSLRIG